MGGGGDKMRETARKSEMATAKNKEFQKKNSAMTRLIFALYVYVGFHPEMEKEMESRWS